MQPTSKTWLSAQAVHNLFTALSAILAFAFAWCSIVSEVARFKKKMKRAEEFFCASRNTEKNRAESSCKLSALRVTQFFYAS
jgi:preprotein translocase subunit SecY